MFGLEGRAVLVTGASRGIGEATVKLLRDLGAAVAASSLSEPAGCADLNLKADVRDPRAMEAAVKRVERILGPLFGIVANAGITRDRLFSRMTQESWRAVMETNLQGVYNTVRPAISRVYRRREGAFVFISSMVGQRGNVGQTNYAASKAALIGFAKALALEGARYGVRANVVAPGFIETRMLASIPPRVKARLLSQIPQGRFGQPVEVAWAVAFLLSPVAARYITGEVLRVNGGQYL